MAELIIRTEKIKNNIKYLSEFFEKQGVNWSLITKVFSGDHDFLEHILTEDVIQNISSIGDSRLTSLKNLRSVNPEMKTIYIKPPAAVHADEVVEYATVSLNSSFTTIKALNEAAGKKGVIHQVIIMLEMGELREGILRDDLLDFYEKVFELPNIEVIGIGSNLGCMYGVEPTYDKLLQLCLYKALISEKFNRDLKYISGGTSITLPLIEKGIVPKEMNHYRIGEAAFFGVSPLDGKQFLELDTDTFDFEANIIELEEKNLVPEGIINEANVGHAVDYENRDLGDKSYKAILDFGLLDVDSTDIESPDPNISFVGITSDMIVVDLGNNMKSNGEQAYKVGDTIRFKPNYMAVARLLNSKFIAKRFE